MKELRNTIQGLKAEYKKIKHLISNDREFFKLDIWTRNNFKRQKHYLKRALKALKNYELILDYKSKSEFKAFKED